MGESRRLDLAWRTTALIAAGALLSLGACTPSEDGLATDPQAAPAAVEDASPQADASADTDVVPGGDEQSTDAAGDGTGEAADEAADGAATGQTGSNDPDSSSGSTTLAALATLAIKGRASKTGYDRAQFGQAWLDADRNGCDTRNDILGRDLTAKTYKTNTDSCVVLTGVRADDYTAKSIAHVRGESKLDIDHRVALSNAWQTGAFGWTLEKRAAFANDPFNLTATDAGANRSKGDGDAATWLPPNKAYRCDYVAAQVAVKQKFGLWVTQPEHDAILRVLGDCPGHLLPRDTTRAATEVDHKLKPVGAASAKPKAKSSPKPKAKSTPKPKPKPKATPTPKQSVDVYYENCTAARDAGAAPVRVGQPGYARHLDRDGDGVGCE